MVGTIEKAISWLIIIFWKKFKGDQVIVGNKKNGNLSKKLISKGRGGNPYPNQLMIENGINYIYL